MVDNKTWADNPSRPALSRRAIAVLRGPSKESGGREIFNIATIERVAEQLFGTSGDRPMLGRLRYLRLMDFPAPVAKGRGTKAKLGLDDAVQILFVLELMHAGMFPTRAVRVIRTDWKTIKTSMAYGWVRENAASNTDRPFRSLVIAPSVLSELGSEDRADELLHEVVGVLSDEDLEARRAAGKRPRRLLIVDTQAFVAALANVGEPLLGISSQEFGKEMELFCVEAFGTAKRDKWLLKSPKFDA